MGWNYDEIERNILRNKGKIGMLKSSSLFPVSRATHRALGIARQKLIDLGYEVVDVEFEDHIWERNRETMLAIMANSTL